MALSTMKLLNLVHRYHRKVGTVAAINGAKISNAAIDSHGLMLPDKERMVVAIHRHELCGDVSVDFGEISNLDDAKWIQVKDHIKSTMTGHSLQFLLLEPTAPEFTKMDCKAGAALRLG